MDVSLPRWFLSLCSMQTSQRDEGKARAQSPETQGSEAKMLQKDDDRGETAGPDRVSSPSAPAIQSTGTKRPTKTEGSADTHSERQALLILANVRENHLGI